MIEWRDIIEITKRMFAINQTQIANFLCCDKSAITRLKQDGAQPRFANEMFFSRIFDPNTPDSPARDKPSFLLDLLKENIETGFIGVRQTLDDCWNEKDYRTFVLIMLQRARHNINHSEVRAKPVVDTNNENLQFTHMRDLFLTAVTNYNVMDCINRKPAIWNREDSTHLNIFLMEIDALIANCVSCDSLLQTSIRSFADSLRIQVLSLDATLNNRFGFDDETASINMEGDDSELDSNDEIMNRLELSEFSIELVETANDPLSLVRLGVNEWGNFKSQMNCLFERISSWNGRTTA